MADPSPDSIDSTAPEASAEVSTEPEKAVQEPIHCDVLPLLVGYQRQHGLRHNDFQRYRRFCTRRIHRIRVAIKLTHGRRTFQNKRITLENLTEERHFHILLLEMERDWAYAMEDKQLIKEKQRKHHHMMSKLRKAVKLAEELEAMVAASPKLLDESTDKELKAYTSWLRGTLAFEQGQWKDAQQHLSASNTRYQAIVAGVEDDETKLLYEQRMQESAAGLRYCAYKLGSSQGDVSDLVKLKAELGESSTMSMLGEQLESTLTLNDKSSNAKQSVEWLERSVAVTDPTTQQALGLIDARKAELATDPSNLKASMSTFDALLMAFGEASQRVQQRLDDELKAAGTNASEDSEARQATLRFLKAYLRADMLEVTLQRNEIMIQNSYTKYQNNEGRPDELVRLYDSMLQIVNESRAVELLQDDPDFQDQADAREAFFKAMRCFYVAQICKRTNKPKEALALFDRTLERITATKAALSKLQTPFSATDDIKATLEMAASEIRGVHVNIKASVFLEATETSETNPDAVADNLEHYDDSASVLNKPIAAIPPPMQTIQCKPLVFDLAVDHVTFPSLKERTKAQASAAEAVTGVFKSLGSWFG
eukprot:m.51757 g.51757  ORF g.51757 m.51757 type:complete len:596 (+) comp13457_c0_seq1:34-1821(+)